MLVGSMIGKSLMNQRYFPKKLFVCFQVFRNLSSKTQNENNGPLLEKRDHHDFNERLIAGYNKRVTFFSPELSEIYYKHVIKTEVKEDFSKQKTNFPSHTCSPESQKLLNVAVVGMPNAGKSSLINALIKRTLCPVSSKVHTTRCKSKNIIIQDSSQVVFIDTPGLVTPEEHKKYNLEEPLLNDPKNAILEADLLCIIHDVGIKAHRQSFHPNVYNVLNYYKTIPSILVLTKVDKVPRKRDLLHYIDNLTHSHECRHPDKQLGWSQFTNIFMVSSLKNQGIDKLRNYLLSQAKSNTWLYPPDTYSELDEKEIVLGLVKAKLMDFLPNEMPYNLKLYITQWQVNEAGVVEIIVSVRAKDHYIKYIIGDKGVKVKKIARLAQQDLMNMLQNEVYLRLSIEKI